MPYAYLIRPEWHLFKYNADLSQIAPLHSLFYIIEKYKQTSYEIENQ